MIQSFQFATVSEFFRNFKSLWFFDAGGAMDSFSRQGLRLFLAIREFSRLREGSAKSHRKLQEVHAGGAAAHPPGTLRSHMRRTLTPDLEALHRYLSHSCRACTLYYADIRGDEWSDAALWAGQCRPQGACGAPGGACYPVPGQGGPATARTSLPACEFRQWYRGPAWVRPPAADACDCVRCWLRVRSCGWGRCWGALDQQAGRPAGDSFDALIQEMERP